MDQKKVNQLFAKYHLPDPPKLETGTYSNMEIAEKIGDLKQLEVLLKVLPPSGSLAARRSMLCALIDLI